MSATLTKFEPSFLDNVGTDLVTIRIGDGDTQESFPVHKDLLTACSPYFKAAFDGEFREALDKAMPVPDVTSTQFRLFLNWLYFRRLPDDNLYPSDSAECPNCTHTETTCEDSRRVAGFTEDFVEHDDEDEHSRIPFEEMVSISEEVDQQLEKMINTGPWNHQMLYVFADRCDVPALRQDLINELWENGWPTYGAIIFAWRNLSIKSPLCKLMLDDYSRLCERKDLTKEEKCGMEVLLRQKLPSEFMWILFSRMLWGNEGMRQPVCAYHEHAQDEETVKRCREEMQRRGGQG